MKTDIGLPLMYSFLSNTNSPPSPERPSRTGYWALYVSTTWNHDHASKTQVAMDTGTERRSHDAIPLYNIQFITRMAYRKFPHWLSTSEDGFPQFFVKGYDFRQNKTTKIHALKEMKKDKPKTKTGWRAAEDNGIDRSAGIRNGMTYKAFGFGWFESWIGWIVAKMPTRKALFIVPLLVDVEVSRIQRDQSRRKRR